MDHGLKLAAVGGAEVALAALIPWPWALALAWPGAVTAVVGLATWGQVPGLLGKRADGGFPAWSFAVFGTWHLLYRALGRGWLLTRRPPTEVHPGWWVGGWPQAADFDRWPAIVDVTAELPRVGDGPYHLVSVLDRGAPPVDVLDAAARWAVAAHAEQPVLVHCTQGRGRSVTVLCAALVRDGLHPTWREAYAHIREQRPYARLQAIQMARLDAWQAACA